MSERTLLLFLLLLGRELRCAAELLERFGDGRGQVFFCLILPFDFGVRFTRRNCPSLPDNADGVKKY